MTDPVSSKDPVADGRSPANTESPFVGYVSYETIDCLAHSQILPQQKIPPQPPIPSPSIESSFQCDDRGIHHSIEEKAVRAPTVEYRYNELEAKKNKIVSELNKENLTIEKKQQLEGQQLKVEQELKNVGKLQAFRQKYASSNTVRKIFAQQEEAKRFNTPLVSNLFVQTITHTHSKSVIAPIQEEKELTTQTFARSAGIADYYHLETSMYELMQIAEGKEDRDFPFDKTEAHNNIYASYGTNKIEEIKQFAEDRKEILESLFLQNLMALLESGKKIDDTFFMGRLSLLNTHKTAAGNPKKAEFVPNEQNVALDTSYIYQQMNNKTIRFYDEKEFEGKGTFVFENEIYIPKKYAARGEMETATLKTAFANFSATGNKKNDGKQKIINENWFTTLEQLLTESKEPLLEKGNLLAELRDFKSKLDTTPADIDLEAEDSAKAVDLMNRIGEHCCGKDSCAISINCLSGKDRTGLFIASQVKKMVKAHFSDENLRQFHKRLLSKEGMALKIAKLNIGVYLIKLIDFRLDLFDMNDEDDFYRLIGHAARIAHYIDSIVKMLFLWCIGPQITDPQVVGYTEPSGRRRRRRSAAAAPAA